jgi:type II secretory pathway component PulF
MSLIVTRFFQQLKLFGIWLVDRPLSTLQVLEFSRSIRFFLSSGMSMRDAMNSLGERGSRATRKVAQAISKDLASGWTLQEAFERRGNKFPTLFLALAAVGEETGHLPEVMKDLEDYYEMQRKQKSQVRSQAMVPVMQFFAAVLIISLLIYILGMMPAQEIKGKKVPFDALGFGLVGPSGALRFLAIVFGGIAAVYLSFMILKMLLRRRAVVEQVLLKIPILGPCLMNLALTRFSFAMRLMLDSSMSILKIIRLGFRATDNPAFMSAGPVAEENLKQGNSIYTALTETRMFPKDYLSSASIGEESGHLPEVMDRLAEYHDEKAKKGIVLLTRIVSTVVWMSVAAFVCFLIFRVFMQYVGQIERNLPNAS